jgi:hypothetical protein
MIRQQQLLNKAAGGNSNHTSLPGVAQAICPHGVVVMEPGFTSINDMMLSIALRHVCQHSLTTCSPHLARVSLSVAFEVAGPQHNNC